MANQGDGTESTYTSPGVPAADLDDFPPSVVSVATAVPVFVGYTECAADPAGKPLHNVPVWIQSMADYACYFGGAVPGCSFAAQMLLFYENGGEDCFVISAGDTSGTIEADALLAGVAAAGNQAGPTMLVVPEACQLDAAGYAQVAQAMVAQAAQLQDRMAILDLPGCLTAHSEEALLACQAQLWAAIDLPADALSYAAAYGPALLMLDHSVLPPSAAVAAAWTANDRQYAVWQAPANIALLGVQDPLYQVVDPQQEAFNLPINGMAVNIIRNMYSLGTVIWGARTLDGNSQDYRFVQVRRTLIYIEQSIKAALGQFVFAPNAAPTWGAVTAMVSAFLTQMWQQGGLMGAMATDAYSVACGLGWTMTGEDILEGNMIVSVKVSINHPAEFIALTITQAMATPNS